MKLNHIILTVAISVALFSCSQESINQKINKTGDMAGQAIGEFSTGVSSGVEKSIQPQITISDPLKSQGIAFGKMTITSDTVAGENVLVAYIIFNDEFKGTITAKVNDSKDLEMGRAKLSVEGKKDEAKYFEFHFDKRTDIDNDSKIILE